MTHPLVDFGHSVNTGTAESVLEGQWKWGQQKGVILQGLDTSFDTTVWSESVDYLAT